MKTIGYWIEAMRLRTLPVSAAGVLMAVAWAVVNDTLNVWPAVLCMAFAVLAQISSNFANEYFDYKAGRDRPGREGPRRGVTEGEISPRAMLAATVATLGLACVVGLSLVAWSGWWLVGVGVAVALGVFAYSAGPWPLSTHGLGEVAVVFFFGIIPVSFTYYLQAHRWPEGVLMSAVAIGLMGANVLIVNNYRDIPDDRAVGKMTLGVRFGARFLRVLYLVNAISAAALLVPLSMALGVAGWLITLIYIIAAAAIVRRMGRLSGRALTPLLGITAMLMFAVALAATITAVCVG